MYCVHSLRYDFSAVNRTIIQEERMFKSRITLLLVTASIANHVIAASSSIPILTTGYHCTQGTSCNDAAVPLVIDSLDQGQSWRAANPSFGLFNGNVAINNSVCSKTGCTMVGFSMGKVLISSLIMKSNDTLTSWSSAKIYGMPFGNMFSGLTDINCQGNHCIAQGGYVVAPHLLSDKPLILESNNEGKTWNFVTLPNTNLLNYESSAFSCGDNFCVLMGRYNLENQYNDLPLIYTNGNKQHTWISTQTINGTPFPFKNASYEISSMSCTGNTCVAVGKYETNTNLNEYIFTITSSDRGQSWYFNDNLSKVFGDKTSKMSNVSCANNTCVVAAYYDYDQSTSVAVSHDLGATWSLGYKVDGSQNFDLMVDCNQNNVCLVSLSAWNNLAVITSQNGGYDWSYNPHVLTDVNNTISIFSLGCEANNCLIVGSNLDETPLILVSHDEGITWINNQNVSNLPSNISEATLNGISNVMTSLPNNLSAMIQSKASKH